MFVLLLCVARRGRAEEGGTLRAAPVPRASELLCYRAIGFGLQSSAGRMGPKQDFQLAPTVHNIIKYSDSGRDCFDAGNILF